METNLKIISETIEEIRKEVSQYAKRHAYLENVLGDKNGSKSIILEYGDTIQEEIKILELLSDAKEECSSKMLKMIEKLYGKNGIKEHLEKLYLLTL